MNLHWTLRAAVLATVAACLAAAAAAAPITAVDVAGARTVGALQVASWSELETGREYSPDLVAAAIRNLFATGKFADVRVYRQDEPAGVRLTINLQEFPRIRQVVFRGNEKVKEEDLRAAYPPAVGQFANPAVLTRELEPLRALYQEKGYYSMAAHLDSSTVDAGNLETVVVTIDEGGKIKARRIEFEGNAVFTDEQLRKQMKQSTGGFLKSATFKKQQFEEDKARIVAWYQDHGYLDATVDADELAFVEDREKVDLTLRVTEGPLYSVGDVNWEGNVVYDDIAVARLITLEKGQIFRENEYQETLQALHSLYWDSGYIYITIEPERHIREQVVGLTFRFQEGSPARVRNVQVVDNLKTHDAVVLREMQLFPGDVFSNSLVGLSQRDIFQLGFFEDVQVDFAPADTEGDIDLVMKVKEKQTGQFSFGMAYSAQTSATGFIQVQETNFRGRGQNLGVAWQFGSRQRYVDLNFTEPWFRGTPTLVGVDLFDRYQYNFDDFYESRVKGLALRLGRRIPGTRYSRVGLRYELSETRLSNFSSAYVNYLDVLEDQIGADGFPYERLDEVDWPRTKSSVTLSLSRNSTDNPFFPTQGSKTTYSAELSGGLLGGEIDYHKHELKQSYFQKLPGGFALNLRTSLGLIVGLNTADGVPDYEKFRLGGNRIYPLRGYRDLEVVPRGNPGFIGGRFYTIMNAEILYPLTKAVQLLGFVDQGDTWNSFTEADFTNLRKGAGFGVRVEVPMMGTIGFDYGYGFDRAGGAGWEPHFNFGTFF
ncbi:MAG: outer membrane protein assembly factor BamA [bacterium]|nr:outer membrane protein assembly factor BamA [bacterium]